MDEGKDDDRFIKTEITAPNGKTYKATRRKGTIEDFFKRIDEVQRQYGHLLDKVSFDEFLAKRHADAERE